MSSSVCAIRIDKSDFIRLHWQSDELAKRSSGASTMQHPVFGKLSYSENAAAWKTHHPLAELARFAVRNPTDKPAPPAPAEPQKSPADVQATMDLLQNQLEAQVRRMLGPQAEPLLAAMNEQLAQVRAGIPDEQQQAKLERQAAKAQRKAKRLRHGLFPVLVGDADQSGPSPEQEAAFRHLVANEAMICQAVMDALYKWYQGIASDEQLRRAMGLPDIRAPEGLTAAAHLLDVTIVPQHQDGVSRLLFSADCDWEVEHGSYVIYHPATGAKATTADEVEEILAGEEAEPCSEMPSNFELLQALQAHNEKRVQKLLAAGQDINALGNPPYPPLCMAVTQMDIDLVKRLLALGADPNLRDFENKTALQRAKQMHRAFDSRKGDKVSQAMLALAQSMNIPGLRDGAARTEEIIRLLQAAGAK
jgi:hypothetical protein